MRRLLTIALLLVAVNGSALELRELVGHKVTLRGRFSLRGKENPFVLVGKVPVYVVPDMSKTGTFTWGEPWASMENRDVTLTGILRRFEPPRSKTPARNDVQNSPPHFFVKLRDTTISLVK